MHYHCNWNIGSHPIMYAKEAEKSGGQFKSLRKNKPQISPKTSVDDFDIQVIRRTVNQYHITQKRHPTLGSLLLIIQGNTNFTGQIGSLRILLKQKLDTATRIPSTVVSSSTKNINDTCDITQSYCTYRDYQPDPSSAFKTDAQKFTRTNYSTNTGNKSSPTCNKPASDNNNSSTNKMKEFSSHEKKFVPKVPSSTLRSNTANIQPKPQVFKFSLSNQSNINL